MSWWTWLSGAVGGRKTSTLDLFRQIYGGRASSAGVTVNWARAIEVAAVLACVRVVANGVAQVPWKLYRGDGTRRAPATDHPLHPLLTRRPNPHQTSFGLRETLVMHLMLTGNAFAWKGMVGAAREIRRLDPIEPGRVTIRREGGVIVAYDVRGPEGSMETLAPEEVWHIRGPSWDAWTGMDAVRAARDAIGLSIAIEQSQAEFYQSGAKVSGLLSMKDKIGEERFRFLAAWLDKHETGGERASKPLILDGGATFAPFQMTGVDAQTLESRKLQIEEICRAFGVMPIMIGYSDKAATYASAEQMFIAHVVHTLSPWYTRIEQSADADLLTDADRVSGLYTKFTANALMRGAAKDRGEFYAKALGAGGAPGWMTPNDVRALEEMDPVEGGDRLFWPPAATPDGEAGNDAPDDAAEDDPEEPA